MVSMAVAHVLKPQALLSIFVFHVEHGSSLGFEAFSTTHCVSQNYIKLSNAQQETDRIPAAL